MDLPDQKSISLKALKAISDPFRARLLAVFAESPSTVPQAAERLGLPVTRLYYHVHHLEKHGFITVVETRPAGGMVEKVYFVTARQFIVDRQEFSTQPEQALAQADILIDFTLTEAAKAIRKSVKNAAIDLTQPAPHPRALQIRRGLGRVTLSQAVAFQHKVNALVEEFTALQSQESEEQGEYLLALAFFPVSLRDKADETTFAVRSDFAEQ
ncbi:MAG: helix-turn-helix domain-containing protein [Anaerolineales bacterium]|nr:helix-turn-helix domain-containing protein [Anaerolineales bacterium]MCX7754378.1 helix-turn-helix domain-containing protein [Anaerolineales bacterium]MDW8277900.1 helix-turn-helix domain-containing protein [Anaerolineales bacterium]